jgi:hypothetical protein
MRIPKRAKRIKGREWGLIGCDSDSKAKLEALAMAGSLAGLLRYIANTLKRSDLVDLDKRRYS